MSTTRKSILIAACIRFAGASAAAGAAGGNGRTTRHSFALGGAYTTAPPATGTDTL